MGVMLCWVMVGAVFGVAVSKNVSATQTDLVVQLTTHPAKDGHPYWSSDGTKIVFHSKRGGNHDIWVMNADGTSQTQITTHPADDMRPHWSPDGTKIVFHSNRSGNEDIWVMNADGSNLVQLTSHPAADTHPMWSPDGTYITFSRRISGRRSLSRQGPNLDVYLLLDGW